MVRVPIPVYLPAWLYQPLRRIKRALRDESDNGLNLWGDRDVEFSFIAANLPSGPGRALDFGSGSGNLSLMAAQRGFEVVGLDLMANEVPWRHSAVRFLQGDLLQMKWPENEFHLVINCSTVEHVGLAGRYGVENGGQNGDLEAMSQLRSLMRTGGVMLLTIPCGRDAVHAPLHRIYGASRLPRLLAGFHIEKQAYWTKDSKNRWIDCTREQALDFEAVADVKVPFRSVYALGCFVLRKAECEEEKT